MRFFFILFVLLAMAGRSALAEVDTGDAVVVVYNTQVSGSKDVADHYAEMRHIPAGQVVGFKMSTNEEISRDEYIQELETPVRQFLEKEKLLVFEPSTDDAGGMRRLQSAKIRYIVLCYGVPLKIAGNNATEPGEEKLQEVLRRNDAAVDSELCFLPWPDPHRMLAGFIPNPCYGTTNADVINPGKGLLMVARLDGPNAKIARGLVDKAMQAENDGLWGRAYFDMRGLAKDDPYHAGDVWIATAARAAVLSGFETVLDDKPPTFSAGFPMSQIALYAGWYDVNASGPFAQSNVDFMPGAFAYHLHSFSAQTLRSTTNHWCGPLLAKGATATMGCVNEPFLGGTPNIGIFFPRWLSGFSFGEAAYACQGALSWQTTVIGDPLYRPFGKSPREQHEQLLEKNSPLLPWSFLRIANMDWVLSKTPEAAVQFLQDEPATRQSALLMEKLGDLFLAEGQTNVAIRSWQKALKLDPTPLQSIRLTLNSANQLMAIGENENALEIFDKFAKKNPNYPDILGVYQKMEPLARLLNKHSQALRYAREINRLEDSKPAAAK